MACGIGSLAAHRPIAWDAAQRDTVIKVALQTGSLPVLTEKWPRYFTERYVLDPYHITLLSISVELPPNQRNVYCKRH